MNGGVLAGGFDEDNSRIAPPEFCNIQRLNRKGEQVFYIAEERDIAVAEQKANVNDYLSIAVFDIIATVHVLDFSAYTQEELNTAITDKMEQAFQNENGFSARQLYVEVQKFFTMLDSSEDFYNVSNRICDILKSDSRIDGIRYWSYYKGHNLGVWGYKPDDYKFIGSRITQIHSFDMGGVKK